MENTGRRLLVVGRDISGGGWKGRSGWLGLLRTSRLFERLDDRIPGPDQCGRHAPGDRKHDVQAFRCAEVLKYGKTPYDAQQTGAEDGQHGREYGVFGPPHHAGGDFVKTAERLERQNVQDPHACRCKDGGIRRKNGRSRRMPERQGHCEERTEACRTADAEPQHPPAAF